MPDLESLNQQVSPVSSEKSISCCAQILWSTQSCEPTQGPSLLPWFLPTWCLLSLSSAIVPPTLRWFRPILCFDCPMLPWYCYQAPQSCVGFFLLKEIILSSHPSNPPAEHLVVKTFSSQHLNNSMMYGIKAEDLLPLLDILFLKISHKHSQTLTISLSFLLPLHTSQTLKHYLHHHTPALDSTHCFCITATYTD